MLRNFINSNNNTMSNNKDNRELIQGIIINTELMINTNNNNNNNKICIIIIKEEIQNQTEIQDINIINIKAHLIIGVTKMKKHFNFIEKRWKKEPENK